MSRDVREMFAIKLRIQAGGSSDTSVQKRSDVYLSESARMQAYYLWMYVGV
jgi:hypothetical protein